MFWGFSEALDLHAEYKKNQKESDETTPSQLNILLFGGSDPRHIIKTLAKCYNHETKINFYVIEACPALIARHMLLMSIALEPPNLLTLLGRTHLFMDVYGNSQLRSSSVGYVNSKAIHLINCVTDLNLNEEKQPVFDLKKLKYIERDCIVEILNFWREKKENAFDIIYFWEQCVRKYLRERYDYRQGAYDWDHQMRLKDNGAHQICSQEYKHWRETGIAFTFPEYRQTHANKTFAVQSVRKSSGKGYIGDIVVGPFCAFGLQCSDSNFLRSQHGQNEFRATDVSERNLFELFYEIHERKPFDSLAFTAHKFGMIKLDNGKVMDYVPTQTNESELKKFDVPLITSHEIRISYLSMHDVNGLNDGEKFQQMFDVVFMGSNYNKLIKNNFRQVFAPNALVLFETTQLSVQRKPEIGEFLKEIRSKANDMGLTSITNFNINLPLPIVRYKNEISQ